MSVTLLNVVEIAAVGAFAYSGAETARRHDMDVVGLTALAVVNGLAGGITRDTLIGQPVLALHDSRLLPTCFAAALVVMIFGTVMPKRVVETVDAIGLGLFTVLGTRRALDAGSPTWPRSSSGSSPSEPAASHATFSPVTGRACSTDPSST